MDTSDERVAAAAAAGAHSLVVRVGLVVRGGRAVLVGLAVRVGRVVLVGLGVLVDPAVRGGVREDRP